MNKLHSVVCTGAAALVRPVTDVVGMVQVPLLASLNAAQRSDLCTALKPRIFNAGESIVRKGEPGEAFYIVESGTCTVLGDSGQVPALHLMLRYVSVAFDQVFPLQLVLHHTSVAFGQKVALHLMLHHASVTSYQVCAMQLTLHHPSVASGQVHALQLGHQVSSAHVASGQVLALHLSCFMAHLHLCLWFYAMSPFSKEL
jgi:hypothetical protein